MVIIEPLKREHSGYAKNFKQADNFQYGGRFMETRKSKVTRRPLTQNKRQQGKKWMGLAVVLGFIFLLIGFGQVKNGYGSPFKLVFGDGQRATKDLLLP